MSTFSDDDPPETVGYGRPPKSGQFRKGQSGNPRGRPRKTRETSERLVAQFPTREALRREAGRRIAIKDAAGRQEVTTTEAVLRAVSVNAMRGGVLAQRIYLEYQKAEDERYYRERKDSFDFWWGYQEKMRALMAAAREAGKAEPDSYPHPDDIEFDWLTLNVRFLGPMDEKEAAATEWLRRYRNLCYTMSVYLGEEVSPPTSPGGEAMIGPYLGLFVFVTTHLPPRLRPMRDEDIPTAVQLMDLRDSGGGDLRRRCEAMGLPFVRWKPRFQIQLMPASNIGLEWPKNMPIKPASMKKRSAKGRAVP